MTSAPAKKTSINTAPAKAVTAKPVSAKRTPRKSLSAKSAPKKSASKKSTPTQSAAAVSAPQSWHVYIVRCADGTFYTGVAIDVARRVDEHNGRGQRGARYTRVRRPVKLVYQEMAAGRSEAGKREYAIKQQSRTAKRALIVAAPVRA